MRERGSLAIGKRMNVMLAIDGSACSEAALDMVATQFPADRARVRVLTADEWPKDLPPFLAFARGPNVAADVEAFHDQRRREAQAMVDRAVRRLRDAGFEAQGHVLPGDPRRVILDESSAAPTDLIVLGSHGRTGLERLLLGSVAESVVRHATCSVQVVRAPAR